ncbi:hypothetical protein E4U39_002652 [Claviceps sp. Clav50 group G5]|nr:hypothetical protein E4U39_002652 [Claviceps sp. Clav50 group G5]
MRPAVAQAVLFANVCFNFPDQAADGYSFHGASAMRSLTTFNVLHEGSLGSPKPILTLDSGRGRSRLFDEQKTPMFVANDFFGEAHGETRVQRDNNSTSSQSS